MGIVELVGLAVLASAISLTLKALRPEMSLYVSLAAGLLILLALTGKIAEVVRAISDIGAKTGLKSEYLGTVIKIIGVGFLAEIGVQTCRDAGEGGIAQKVEIGAKVTLLAMGLPAIMMLVDMVLEMVP